MSGELIRDEAALKNNPWLTVLYLCRCRHPWRPRAGHDICRVSELGPLLIFRGITYAYYKLINQSRIASNTVSRCLLAAGIPRNQIGGVGQARYPPKKH
jgi:hypothetical protein